LPRERIGIRRKRLVSSKIWLG